MTKSEQISELKKLYHEFLKEYLILHDILDISHPLEISTLYNYLLYNGYISFGNKFTFKNEDAIDIKAIEGVNIIAGGGVCRHIASGLSDILNEEKIESYPIAGYLKKFQYHVYDKKDYINHDKVIKWVNKNVPLEMQGSMIELIREAKTADMSVDIEFISESKRKRMKKAFVGTHMITMVNHESCGYFIDTTNNSTYHHDLTKPELLYSEKDLISLRNLTTYIYNYPLSSEELKRIQSLIKNNTNLLTFEEEKAIINKTKEICQSNKDLFFDKFNHNQGLIEEIASKFGVLKKEIGR